MNTTFKRYVGIDVGAETIKVVELVPEGDRLRWTRREIVEHHKNPGPILLDLLRRWDWEGVRGAAVSGRLSRQVNLPRIPIKQAQAAGYRFLRPDRSGTLVSIGSHGFSVLELHPSGVENFRENSRCSQGTGNFLRQLVERFELTVEEASRLCEDVQDPALLSGRCPVILKTDMTHLANKGESRAPILAGLYDAVCENVQVLIKPRLAPPSVTLIGGVARSRRIRENFRSFLYQHGMLLEPDEGNDALFFEAVGGGVIAASQSSSPPALDQLLKAPPESRLEEIPPLSAYLGHVTRMTRPSLVDGHGNTRQLILGFDIGSTGSKALALDARTRETVWEAYLSTNGDPLGASHDLMRRFVKDPASRHPVVALGATGSGREIVGSLMTTCYGKDSVFIMNEIAAHAEGALHYDSSVDTIFEIGGQDAKYIRLADGRVIDAAMNEACSAGTGSFIEEQGNKFDSIDNVVQLGERALVADSGVSLGQHCSVFMAEIIDESVAAGVDQTAIIAGLYDSIIQNYLNRVKGNRSVGKVIFCQGMPFSADALAAAVARQTGSQVIVPPSPGSVGALGIALLTAKELSLETRPALDLHRFLDARVEKKDTFVCKATEGCGGSGNKCRIDRISTIVAGKRSRFSWGGGCSLHDSGTGKRKLPDRSPDPFREREELVAEIIREVTEPRGRPRIAMTDEFVIKGLFPFFATFLHQLGFDLDVRTGATQGALKRGIEEANVPYCAPMQLYHGLVSMMAEETPDYLFLPMLRSLPRVADEPHAVVCPIGQGSPDLLRWDLADRAEAAILSPVIDIGADGLESAEFLDSCRRLAAELGVKGRRWRRAHRGAMSAQQRFDARCLELGQRALDFCAERDLLPIVVLGRAYTIYNTVLNSNVPAILREQGAMAIPVDCFPLDDDVPVFRAMYWGQGQRNLRAAHRVRRSPGVYSLFCSNYACGPDSFSLHFYSYIMDGKPFAIIETDGHSGDAGTKTRVEAFLYCVRQDLRESGHATPAHRLHVVEQETATVREMRGRQETLLLPYFSPMIEALASCYRGVGLDAEVLPMADQEALRIGRRYTSGKECVPLCLTLGSFLKRIMADTDRDRRFALLMPRSTGPCRFGVYNLLQKIVMEQLDLKDRVGVWSPPDSGYFSEFTETEPGFSTFAIIGMGAIDMLTDALYDVRPVERRPGAAQEIHSRYVRELRQLLEETPRNGLSRLRSITEVVSGRLFGCADLLRRAAAEFREVKGPRRLPTVLLVGEIFVRLEPFANDFIVDQLERRGMRVKLVPSSEWFEYLSVLDLRKLARTDLKGHMVYRLQRRIHDLLYDAVASQLDWPSRTTVPQTLAAAATYVRPELEGEAVLTVGGPVHEWREGRIDAAVNVGPLECMPTKIAEAQFFHAAEREGLPAITLPFNGDPIDPEVLDGLAFEVHRRFNKQVETSKVPKRASGQRSVFTPLPMYSPVLTGRSDPAAVARPASHEPSGVHPRVEEYP